MSEQQPTLSSGVATVEHTTTPTRTNSFFVAFFAEFDNFQYDPSRPVVAEFRRLRATPEWNSGINRRITQERYRTALVLQFNETYGTNQNDLASWQNLCRALGMQDIPEDIKPCKRAIAKLHVNLVDLVDIPNTNKPVRHFQDVKALSKYSKKQKKIFPRDEAKAGGILKYLLRELFSYHAKR